MSEENNEKPNPAGAFQNLLEKHSNDGVKLAAQLFDENYTLRTTIRELTGKQPAEGAMVLQPEDAKAWKAFKDLGIDAKEIKKSLERLPELEKQNRELSGMETLRELADLGLDGSKLKLSVLKDQLQKFPDAEILFKTEKTQDGKEAKVAYIKPTKEDAETSFTQFASEKLADYLPALKVSSEAQPPKPGNAGSDPAPTSGAGGFFDRIRESVKGQKSEAPNIDARFGKAAIN